MTPPEVDRQIHSEIRRPLWTIALAASGLLFGLLPLSPVMRERLGAGIEQTGVVAGFFVFSTVAATFSYHVLGRWSRTYVVFNASETMSIALGTAYLISYSGKPDSGFWFLYFGQILHNGSSGTSRRFNFVFLSLAPLLIAGSFIWRRDIGATGMVLALGLIGVYVYGTLSRAAERLTRAIEDREALQKRLAEVQVDAERARIARDLHDGVGAELSALLWAVREADPALETRINKGVEELRNVVWALRGQVHTWDELCAYLRSRGRELCGRDIGFELTALGDGAQAIDPALGGQLLRIVLELVRNSVRHAQPGVVSVKLEAAEAIVVEVSDDGRGFDVGSTGGRPGGLANLRVRTAELGGGLSVESGGGGTRIQARLPRT